MKILRAGVFLLVDIAMFFTLLFSSVYLVVYSDTYFKWHYEAHGIEATSGMSIDDLMRVTDYMMDYLIGGQPDLVIDAKVDGVEREVFNTREKEHMADVRTLFIGAKRILEISTLFLLVFFLITSIKARWWIVGWFGQLKYFFTGLIIVVAILGIMFYTDFTKYFLLFHHLFFSNNLWVLDPATDILINMVPEIFFYETALLCLGVFVLMNIIVLAVGNFVRRNWLKRHRSFEYHAM